MSDDIQRKDGQAVKPNLTIRKRKVKLLLETEGEIHARPDGKSFIILRKTITCKACPSLGAVAASACQPAACHLEFENTRRVQLDESNFKVTPGVRDRPELIVDFDKDTDVEGFEVTDPELGKRFHDDD
ncbi:MAG: hypothetical protein AAGC55_30915, partial [Myxococcota bacterium]